MRKRPFSSWLGVLFAGVLMATSCSSSESSSVGQTADQSAGDSETEASADEGQAQVTDDADSDEPILVGSVLDITGPLSVYGIPMSNADELAIADINASGGVLGRQLELVALDSQSDNAEYTIGARQLAEDDDIAVVQGGITSASREAIRPIFGEEEKLYFYNVLYEGGLCDRNTFVTGETPTQQLAPMLEWAVKEGKTKWYVVAANYNFGQISAVWAQEMADQYGAEIVGGPEFFDLSIDNFTDQMPQIQASEADLIVSFLVGPSHLNFYKQWSASGLNESTTIVSTTFGFGEEQIAVGEDGAGILAAYPFFSGLGTRESDAFEELWAESGISSSVTPGAVATWNGWHLWAEAANAAGTLDRDAVITQLEAGVTYDGPSGEVSISGGSHHATVPMRLWESDGSGAFAMLSDLSSNAAPIYEESMCDLVAFPDTNEQFIP